MRCCDVVRARAPPPARARSSTTRVVGERRGALRQDRAAGSGCRRGRCSSSSRAAARCSSARATMLAALSGCGSTMTRRRRRRRRSWSKRQPTLGASSRPLRRCCCCCGCCVGGTSSAAALRARRRQLVDAGERLRHPAHRLRHHARRAGTGAVAPRFWIATRRPRSARRRRRAGATCRRRRRASRRCTCTSRLGLAAALVGAAQHRHVGVVAADATFTCRPVQRVPSVASMPTQPYGGTYASVQACEALASRDAAEVAADVARGQPDVAAERDQHVGEVLADAAAAGEHLGDRSCARSSRRPGTSSRSAHVGRARASGSA